MKMLTVMISLVGACLLLAGAANAQDPVKVAPEMNKVLLNNDRVRVLDVVVKPGEKMPMHSHPDNVLYVITGGSTKSTDSEDKVTALTTKAGECSFRKGETHAVENTGETEVQPQYRTEALGPAHSRVTNNSRTPRDNGFIPSRAAISRRALEAISQIVKCDPAFRNLDP
jgi:quercetin dioxygenase-like cupin family protein